MKKFLGVILCLVMFLVSFPVAVAAEVVVTGISGIVIDANTNLPLEGITVTVLNDIEAVDTTTTGTNGAYSSSGLDAGYYFVQFSDSSGKYQTEWYLNASGSDGAELVQVIVNQTTIIDAALVAISTPGPTGIVGTVTSSLIGNPIAGIEVSLIYNNSWVSTTGETDTNGHYEITGLAPGTYRVCFSDLDTDNYKTEWYSDSPDWDNGIDVQITQNQLATVNEDLYPWGKISGKVTNIAGTGLSGIQVRAISDSGSFNTVTDENGNYQALRLATNSDTYKLYFYDASGNYASEWYHDSLTESDASTVILTDSAPTANVDEQLSLPGTIQGVLQADYENEGTFLAGVTAYAFDLNYNYIQSNTSNNSGFYSISGLLPGSYKIQFSTIQGFNGEWFDDQLSFEAASPVTVPAGDTVTADAKLTPWGNITGRVTDSLTGAPVQDVKVEVYEDDNPEPSIYGGNQEGYYGASLRPGFAYRVCISDFSGDYASQWIDNISVEAEQIITKNLTLIPFGKISGRVTNSSDSPLIDVAVTAYSGSELVGQDSTDVSGNYQIGGLTEGSYNIHFYYPHWESGSYIPEWYSNVYNDTAATSVAVSTGITTIGIDATLEAYGKIFGEILDDNTGLRISSEGLNIELYDLNINLVASGELNPEESGWFEIPQLIPGEYNLFFHDDAGIYQDEWWENKSGWSEAITIQITDGEQEYIVLRLNQDTATAPEITSLTLPANPIAIGNLVTGSAMFTDNEGDVHTADWNWGDGIASSGTVNELNNTITGTHNYTTPGVYRVILTLTDAGGLIDSETFEFVVIYDPNGGFVTGGGWIDSPSGALTANPSLTGKANFGFVSKYLKGAKIPTGNTEFQFQTGEFNFKSSAYEWLVINQSGTSGQFKGSGTINGEGLYKFMLWVGDGTLDTFRIKIWREGETGEQVIYDNVVDRTIGGGSIVIYTKK